MLLDFPMFPLFQLSSLHFLCLSSPFTMEVCPPIMVQIAIDSAADHGINLHHGVSNLANGDCLFESVADNISTRACFNETWDGSAEFNRIVWMEEAEDLVLEFSGGAGRTEKVFRQEWAILKNSGTYEYELADFILVGIAHVTRKDILIFNTQVHGAFDPIFVVQASTLAGRPANTEDPVILAYNEVHYEGLVPNSENDRVKIAALKNRYLSNQYTLKKQDLPVFQRLSQVESKSHSKTSYAEAVKSVESVRIVDSKQTAKLDNPRCNKNKPEETKTGCNLTLEELRMIKVKNRTIDQKRRYNQLMQEKKRKSETQEKKEARLQQDKKVKRESQEARSYKEKEELLRRNAVSQKKSREAKCQSEKEENLKKDREAKKKSRKTMTKEKREENFEKQKEYKKKERQSKTPEEKERDLKNKKECMKKSREGKTPNEKEDILEQMRNNVKKLREKRRQENPLIMIALNKDFNENSSAHFRYSNIGNLFEQDTCEHCQALKWAKETPGFCCHQGKIDLEPIHDPPRVIKDLLKQKEFTDNIRAYNNALALASLGTDHKQEIGPNFKIQGKLHHKIGALAPVDGDPKFAQIYFFDSDHELENRLQKNDSLNPEILATLQECLHQVNPYIKDIKAALEIVKDDPECRLVLKNDLKLKPKESHTRSYNLPSGSEVAVLLPGDQLGDLDVVLQTRGGELQRINSVHRSYDPLHYVLLLPFGQDGFKPGLSMQKGGGKVSVMQFYAYRLQVRKNSYNILLKGHRLTQQYITDQFAKVERARLTWAHLNQKTIKAEKYRGLLDAYDNGDIASAGKRFILPPSISYSPRWYVERYQDGMSIVKHTGKPDLFVTFTCNPKWPEITQSLNPGETAYDRPDICARVFNIKAKELVNDIVKNEIFGKTVAHVETIEWQKRKGLPHLHLLVTLHHDFKIRDATDIDKFVSAEIPDWAENPRLFEAVKNHMIHGPCGKLNKNSPCMEAMGNSGVKICSKEFPKSFQKETEMTETSYPVYMRRKPEDGGRTFELLKGKNSITVDNSYVVPYNPVLLLKYDSHINVEIVTTVLAVKYLYKYISKGPDRTIVKMTEDVNEIEQFLDCRYLSASESVWKLFGFNIHGKSHTVMKLSCHLESEQTVLMEEGEELKALLAGEPETTLTAFFKKNIEDPQAREVLYPDFPSMFTWKTDTKEWKTRKIGTALGRIPTVPFNMRTMELYSLRVILHHVPGATSYAQLRTVKGKVFPTFHSACIELGLMDDEQELDRALDEATSLQFGDTLRNFFVSLLIYLKPSNPFKLWEDHKHQLAADWIKTNSLEEGTDMVLVWLRDHLGMYEVTLKSLGIPEPKEKTGNVPKLIEQELRFDHETERNKALTATDKMNDEQKTFFDSVISAINKGRGGLFFLDAPGGTGKTFVLNALLSAIRSDGHIALGTAISAVASKLLENGSTLHSKLKVPIKINETSLCDFSSKNVTGKLLLKTKLLIIDEVTMGHKHIYEAIDRSLQQLLDNDDPFGDKVVVFSGDWRQCLPVVPRGSDSQVIASTLKFSYLWKYVHVYHLTKNMRVQLSSSPKCKEFSDFLLSVGDGSCTGGDMIDIPSDMHLDGTLCDLIDFVFPSLQTNYRNRSWLSERAVLCPTNEQANEVNNLVADQFPGDIRIFKSTDTTSDRNPDFSPEFLNTLDLPGMAPHTLKLKKGMLVMLIRNLNPAEGHCNGVKYVINNLLDRVIEVTAVSGSNVGAKLFVPRVIMDNNDSTLPFSIRRRQFPLRIAFAMTANKAQGQTLARVGVYLGSDFFSHGQLYVALSQCGNRASIKIISSLDEELMSSGRFSQRKLVNDIIFIN